ncbi:nucleotidyltransferase family protein [Shewanella aestuarii]|uniref:Nucleotidyltransferase family protein n=2 Tax=Shewanella aestuarii TaxID=1028752 RepID=A0A6G9QM05_9GAMM|nr:nucleotidyltransferase family protein [Shewanella aestuarii]
MLRLNNKLMPVNIESKLAQQLVSWIKQDAMRMQVLEACATVFTELAIDDWLIAAGFVRNLVWDKLHDYEACKLNDIDVIYYCRHDTNEIRDKTIELQLSRLIPPEIAGLLSVKNQARMHTRNTDDAYQSCVDAMSYWPEKQTAVGVKLTRPSNMSSLEHQIEVKNFFGLQSLFDLSLSHNPKRDMTVFEQRVEQKRWLVNYRKLTLISKK